MTLLRHGSIIFILCAWLCSSCIASDSPATAQYLRGLRAEKGEEGNTDPLSCYNKAIQLDSKQSTFYRARAAYLSGKGEYLSALQDLNRAIEVSPNWYYLYYERGLCRCRLREFSSARNDFDIAIKGQPGNNQFYSGLALAYLCDGKLQEALKSIDLALDTEHPCAQWQYQRGIILSRLGRHADATAQFGRTEALTIMLKGTKSRRVYFDGKREVEGSNQLTPEQLTNIWVKPVNVDYYRDGNGN